MRTIIYLAHPVRHADPAIRRLNFLRAITFGRLLAREGYAPFVPGASVGMVVEGYPLMQEPFGDPTPMEICLSHLEAVYEADGKLVVLLPDIGPMTEGCVIEVNEWQKFLIRDKYKKSEPVNLRWVALGERMKAHGLEEVWTALRSPADLPRAAKVLGVTC